ncbi:hypothetical protein PAPYR_10555 [Paratrimastix pyriformis]|uniref:Uncharacterized protein n=1 Tax=Paratrimastix pyriformis TaxID=342808 RepID=A0ABQ8U9F7_9EUKA|nr:hypothetical protein PAPYR_10555 [Paratrimastix pyriformis]
MNFGPNFSATAPMSEPTLRTPATYEEALAQVRQLSRTLAAERRRSQLQEVKQSAQQQERAATEAAIKSRQMADQRRSMALGEALQAVLDRNALLTADLEAAREAARVSQAKLKETERELETVRQLLCCQHAGGLLGVSAAATQLPGAPRGVFQEQLLERLATPEVLALSRPPPSYPVVEQAPAQPTLQALAKAEASNARLMNHLKQERDRTERLLKERAALHARLHGQTRGLGEQLTRQRTYLAGALRRIRWLVENQTKTAAQLDERNRYVRQLEAKLLALTARLIQAARRHRQPQAQQTQAQEQQQQQQQQQQPGSSEVGQQGRRHQDEADTAVSRLSSRQAAPGDDDEAAEGMSPGELLADLGAGPGSSLAASMGAQHLDVLLRQAAAALDGHHNPTPSPPPPARRAARPAKQRHHGPPRAHTRPTHWDPRSAAHVPHMPWTPPKPPTCPFPTGPHLGGMYDPVLPPPPRGLTRPRPASLAGGAGGRPNPLAVPLTPPRPRSPPSSPDSLSTASITPVPPVVAIPTGAAAPTRGSAGAAPSPVKCPHAPDLSPPLPAAKKPSPPPLQAPASQGPATVLIRPSETQPSLDHPGSMDDLFSGTFMPHPQAAASLSDATPAILPPPQADSSSLPPTPPGRQPQPSAGAAATTDITSTSPSFSPALIRRWPARGSPPGATSPPSGDDAGSLLEAAEPVPPPQARQTGSLDEMASGGDEEQPSGSLAGLAKSLSLTERPKAAPQPGQQQRRRQQAKDTVMMLGQTRQQGPAESEEGLSLGEIQEFLAELESLPAPGDIDVEGSPRAMGSP